MTRKIKYEIEEYKATPYISTRRIKVEDTYLWNACSHCWRWGIFEFPTKEMAENYIKGIIEIVEKKWPDLLKQIAEWQKQLQI